MVAFFRRTPKRLGLYVANADGSRIRQLVSEAQLRGSSRSISLTGRIHWAQDGTKLLFGVDFLHSCNSDGVYRVNLDGLGFHALWRRPSRLLAYVTTWGWSPDGARALFSVTDNDGDCYGSHIGPEALMTVTDDTDRRAVKLLTASALGSVYWSPDGSKIGYSTCEYTDPCNLSTLDTDTGKTHLLTHYKRNTSPYDGFDRLPFRWVGSSELVLGRFLSLYRVSATNETTHRVITVPCPRPNGNCSLSEVTLYGVSPNGHAVFDARDIRCNLCRHGPAPVSKRYVIGLRDLQLLALPDPHLPVDDVYLP